MATDEPDLRLPYPPPSHPDCIEPPTKVRLIRFRHPGYPDNRDLLFSLAATDNDGVHHETARLACAVVAGNRWDGFLCEKKDGQQRFMGGTDRILRAPNYYFHLPNASNNEYAITPTFYHWTFPHNDLPKTWENVDFSSSQRPSKNCNMTLSEESVENAHLVPGAEQPWFDINEMGDYTKSTGMDKMKHIKNMIRLRSDIHKIFDTKRFTIVPKKGMLVVHVFKEATPEVIRLYHNVPLQQLEAAIQFLFARFAYTVFECLRTSLQSGKPKKFRLLVGVDMEERECTGEECVEFAMETASQGKKRSKSRSTNSRKKQNTQNTDDVTLEDSEATDEEDQRGRKRRRTGESWWSPVTYMSTNLMESELAVSVAGTRQVVA